MRYISIATLLLVLNINIKADFFAYRKLIHPQTQNVLHMLYDVHASVIANSALEKKLNSDMQSIVEKGVEEQKKMRGMRLIDHREDLFKQIDEQINALRNNLPNCVKQHDDLIRIVKEYHVSLINEDNGDPEEILSFFPLGAAVHKYYSQYIDRITGTTKEYGTHMYREMVNPMFGVGKALVGKFTMLKFDPLGKAYYFNPDARRGGIGGDRAVDTAILGAINTLFKHNQDAVIVAAGFDHIIHVTNKLIKHGYKAYDVIISNDLAHRRKQLPSVDELLKTLEENNVKKYEQLIKAVGFSEELVYSLIAKPLNIYELMSAELNVKPAAKAVPDVGQIKKNDAAQKVSPPPFVPGQTASEQLKKLIKAKDIKGARFYIDVLKAKLTAQDFNELAMSGQDTATLIELGLVAPPPSR